MISVNRGGKRKKREPVSDRSGIIKKGTSAEKKKKAREINVENGAMVKRNRDLINVGLVYPNTYMAGMSNLGFQSVFYLFNRSDSVACHRFFLPDVQSGETSVDDRRAVKRIEQDNQSGSFSYETGIALARCDIIAFSVSFENDYINIVSILRNSGIPPRSSARGEEAPFVIAGGVACFLNPEPIAPFIDCFLLGEAEEMIPSFLDIYSSTGEREILKKTLATELEGAYIPSFYEPSYDSGGSFAGCHPVYDDIPSKITVSHIYNLEHRVTTSCILSSATAFNDTFLIETGRGCHHGCRFCSAGFIYRPPRFYSDTLIIDAMDRAKELTGKVGLVGATVSDHPKINDICTKGIEENLQISFSSLRLDSLTDETVRNLADSLVKTATIAPEAGSQRMRDIINKKIDEEQILSAVERLVDNGIMNLKLYFMIGLPFELDSDVVQIVELTKRIKASFLEMSRKKGKMGTITLSINPFIPKPSTPFQWCPMDTPSEFSRKISIIRSGLKKIPNIVVHVESSKVATLNALLSRGDRRVASLIETASEKGWRAALRYSRSASKSPGCEEASPEIQDIIFRRIDNDSPLPWDIVDTGIKKEFLLKELKRAEEEKITPDCPMKDCSRCGICR